MSTPKQDPTRMFSSGSPVDPGRAQEIFDTHYEGIFRFAYALLGDRQDARDAAQETFVVAFTYFERFQPGTNLRAWLTKIAYHKAHSILRKRKVRQTLERILQGALRLAGQSSQIVERVIQNEAEDVLWKAIRLLDEKHRQPLILYYLEGFSAAEIAEILDLKKGTVYSRLHYALRQLRGLLLADGIQERDQLFERLEIDE